MKYNVVSSCCLHVCILDRHGGEERVDEQRDPACLVCGLPGSNVCPVGCLPSGLTDVAAPFQAAGAQCCEDHIPGLASGVHTFATFQNAG